MRKEKTMTYLGHSSIPEPEVEEEWLTMTLDQAIAHSKSKAGNKTLEEAEYQQLMKWLIELRLYRAKAERKVAQEENPCPT